jgi:hypothetical protein
MTLVLNLLVGRLHGLAGVPFQRLRYLTEQLPVQLIFRFGRHDALGCNELRGLRVPGR